MVSEISNDDVTHILYKINLDKGNRREKQEVIDIDVFDGFIIEKLFSYTADNLDEARDFALKSQNEEEIDKQEKEIKTEKKEISSMNLIDLFCRGSSEKQVIDINEKTIIFFLHKGAIYKWSDTNQDKIELCFVTDSKKFIFMNDCKLLLLHDCYDPDHKYIIH